ncbi:SDR family oxidoreductase [uncultured Levyella sp.]|uniref:SDR family NAD(P)-dependent oxidoreductase n=1 Tax=uncultured Levyella sp. TaxID=1715800 RepID=UPI00258F58B4|nr:SDR family NAD(P)-dependent oxidoreductase [uncultured Levyella sp.]
MKTIDIITGASSGIGREFAKELDPLHECDEIWLIARRRERLEALAKTLNTPCRLLDGDLTDPAFSETLKKALAEENVVIHTLVNAAGCGKIGTVEELGVATNQAMLALNVNALTAMTALCLPNMETGGRILQLASVAAFSPQPNFAVYAASKAYVLSFTRALHRELKSRHITVTAVCPNPVETEFFDHAGSPKACARIKNIGVETAEAVVKTALRRSAQGKDVSVSSPIAKAIHLATKLFPHSFVLWVEKQMGF